MLAKKFKISGDYKIQTILKKGQRLNAKYFRLRYLRNNRRFSRFCAIVSGKICKTAVNRNRLRRQMYEIIRLNWHVGYQPCYDIVVLCSAESAKTSYAELTKYLINCFKKLTNE